MRRLTLWGSMYSDMSRVSRARSSPKTAFASALHSAVFPTPVGPRKKNEPMGRFPSRSPALLRRTARDRASTAASCPTTYRRRASSKCSRRADSSAVRSPAGMPVQPAKTSATSAGSTRWLSRDGARRTAAQASSKRSSALSGRKRSGRFCRESSTAAETAASLTVTPWCAS